jgi:hypothetical protein
MLFKHSEIEVNKFHFKFPYTSTQNKHITSSV